MVALLVSLDGLTASVILLGLVAALPASGLSVRVLLGRAWPVGVAALSIGLFNVVFAADQLGPTLAELGPVRIGAETLANGAGLSVRLVAIALAGLLATATSEPIAAADALVQQLRTPPRVAIGVLAALRLLPLLAREWQILGLARRARGVDAGHSPLAAVRLFGGQLLALLVGAIRRGSRMALAMEARGFGSRACRSVARPQRMRPADWGWLAGAVLLGAGAVALSLAAGTWRPLLG
jgi:energy-coupling factor transport system permease protein